MLFLGYRIPRIVLESSSALGDVCLRDWILTLEGMFCFRVCLGEEHARSELRKHRDESGCLGSARVCSYSRGMWNKAFVSRGAVPPLPWHSFSPRSHHFDLLSRASLICMLLCVESLAGREYIFMLCGERLASFLSQGFQHLEWLWGMSLPVLSQSVAVCGCSSPSFLCSEGSHV